jgi:hypothetical protein
MMKKLAKIKVMKGIERENEVKIYNGGCKMVKEQKNEAEEGQGEV